MIVRSWTSCLFLIISCHFALAGSTSAPAVATWDKSAKGVKLQYPADWKQKQSPDYELMLLPPGASNDARRITVDIPDLPPHLPFMIRMSRVEHDYLDDLKKEHPGLKVSEEKDVNLADSQARFVRSVWQEGKQQHEDIVLLIIHASAVYILDAQTDDDHLQPTRAAFDSMQASIQWVKH